MEKKNETLSNSDYPIKEKKYSQNIEDMKILLDSLKEQMRSCPTHDIIFNLSETVDYYNLQRNFNIKSSSGKNDSKPFTKFRDSFLANIHTLETFISIPLENDIENVKRPNKDNKLNSSNDDDINNIEVKKSPQEKFDRFIFLPNENKKKVVKAMNIYLKNNDLNDVHFYVKSIISIDKSGIKESVCFPIIYGETTKDKKNMIDNLITIINGQDLFYDIQCKVNYKEN